MRSSSASDSTLSTYTASDGDNLAVQDWPLPEGLALRGVVVIVHGLGEHAWRYDRIARRLNDWGFAVRGYDQYGHGDSGGVRGALPSHWRLVDDLADIVSSTRSRMDERTPLIVMGHSMGGLVACAFVAKLGGPVDGLVLSSPALATRLSLAQRLMLAGIPRIAPNFTVGNGLNPDFLSRDPAVAAAYRNDERVHDRISGRLGLFIAEGGRWVIQRAPQWRVPTLLVYAGADQLVDPSGSRAFARAAPQGVVTERCLGEAFHEVFNEPDAEPAFEAVKQWLDERFP
ncbi:MAG TPA: lysophospholipase [Ramlibacter sp.]|uniref:alpha/beta hydrolase n=1 Tax=Ramlibacter sp. TaxID=1917967 RepID=UPI002CE16D33|nr:lysophospholipase [Ramlibacter sp.]HVZ46956.1 lysophospholipase [Ramlibacter sp.]